MASNPVKWSDGKVGYDPGQSQSLTVSFKSRDVGKVVVNYSFYAHSLGYDGFTYSERHNKVTIWVGGKSTSFTYQANGHSASRSSSGSITINDVKNGVTELEVYYRNERIWVNAPAASYSPRSTGVQGTKKIGTLKIPDNVKYDIKYYKGYSNGKISNVPDDRLDIYKGSKYKISKKILKDKTNHYVFKKGYTTSKKEDSDVNTKTPNSFTIGSKHVLNENKKFYACWEPQTYTYEFYTSSQLNKAYPDVLATKPYPIGAVVDNTKKLLRSYKYNSKNPTYLPNLNNYTANNSSSNIFYKLGYDFGGWNSKNGRVPVSNLGCRFDSNTKFYPIWTPISSKIIFNYGFNNYTRSLNYTYDTSFNFNSALRDKSGEYKSNTLLRPGYKLIGWVYDKSLTTKIYDPFKAPKVNFKFDAKQNIILPNNTSMNNAQFKKNGLNLYAVWEYYTTVFIYTNNTWKLALPYVYTINNGVGSWKIALTYGYIIDKGSANPSWKL